MADDKLDLDVRYAALSERVQSTVQTFTSFRAEVQTSLSNISASIASLAQEVRSNQRTPWATIIGMITIGLSIVGMVGWLAYWPVQNAVVDLKNYDTHVAEIINALPSRFLSLDEFDRRLARASEDRQRVEAVLASLPTTYVPRNEINVMMKMFDDLHDRVERLERTRVSHTARQIGD